MNAPSATPSPLGKSTHVLVACAAFFTALVVHEAAHLAISFLFLGGRVAKAWLWPFRFLPELGLCLDEVSKAGFVVDGVWPEGPGYGFAVFMGAGSTALLSMLALAVLRFRANYTRRARVFLWYLSFSFIDLPTYLFFPMVGLPHWIIFGSRHPEPLVGWIEMGLPPYLLVIGAFLWTIGMIVAVYRSRRYWR